MPNPCHAKYRKTHARLTLLINRLSQNHPPPKPLHPNQPTMRLPNPHFPPQLPTHRTNQPRRKNVASRLTDRNLVRGGSGREHEGEAHRQHNHPRHPGSSSRPAVHTATDRLLHQQQPAAAGVPRSRQPAAATDNNNNIVPGHRLLGEHIVQPAYSTTYKYGHTALCMTGAACTRSAGTALCALAASSALSAAHSLSLSLTEERARVRAPWASGTNCRVVRRRAPPPQRQQQQHPAPGATRPSPHRPPSRSYPRRARLARMMLRARGPPRTREDLDLRLFAPVSVCVCVQYTHAGVRWIFHDGWVGVGV